MAGSSSMKLSMLGHKDAVKLFKLAEENGLKLNFVGDPMQHGAVARGALMRILEAVWRHQAVPAF